jgi:AmpD protein
MQIDSTGLIQNVNYVSSPNCNARPDDVPIDLLIIHNISLPPAEFLNTYVKDFFSNVLDPKIHPYFETIQDKRVSAHCFINRIGELTQFVPFTQRAWHAGESIFQGRENCNDYSIGIELEGTDDIPYTDIQYQILANLIKVLQSTYTHISSDRIVGHSTVSPGRKTDPGPAFDWKLLFKLIETNHSEEERVKT